jgi:hypothetical protein
MWRQGDKVSPRRGTTDGYGGTHRVDGESGGVRRLHVASCALVTEECCERPARAAQWRQQWMLTGEEEGWCSADFMIGERQCSDSALSGGAAGHAQEENGERGGRLR